MGPGPGAHSWLNQGTELQAGQWLEGIRGRLGCRRLRFSPPPAAWVHWPLGSRPPHGQAGLCRPRQDTGLLVQEVVPLSGECVVASGSAAGQPSGGCGRRGEWVGHCEATHPHPVRTKGSPLPHEGFLSYSDSQGRVRPAGRRALGPHQELCPLPASHRPLSSSAGPWPLPLLQAAPQGLRQLPYTPHPAPALPCMLPQPPTPSPSYPGSPETPFLNKLPSSSQKRTLKLSSSLCLLCLLLPL